MAFYEIGVRTPAPSAGAAFATIHTGTPRVKIREIQLFGTAATAIVLGLIRPSNTPVATTSQVWLPQDPGDSTGTVNVDTAWSTAPTVGTVFLRRFSGPANIGAGIMWTWPYGSGLTINATSWLVLWGIAAGPACDLTIIGEE